MDGAPCMTDVLKGEVQDGGKAGPSKITPLPGEAQIQSLIRSSPRWDQSEGVL